MNNTQAATSPSLVIRRTFDAPRERLFEAWSTPAIMERFLGPDDVKAADIRVDFKVGGKYSITMIKPDGERLVAYGTYREIVSPEKIVCTWQWEEDDPALEKETLLTLEFFARGQKTEFVLTHEAFRDNVQRDNHQGGWTAIVDQLSSVL